MIFPSPPIISDFLSMKSSTTSLQNLNQSHAVCCSIWCSFRIAAYGTFCIMWYLRSMISSRVSLLLVNHKECIRLRVALHRWPRLPFPHHQRYLSMTLSLFQRDLLLPHVGQSNSLFKSPHSCKNLTPFSWSENEPKEQCGRKTISPHCTMPEGSLGDERQVLHFVLVSLDHS